MLLWAVSDGAALPAAHQFSKKSKKYDAAYTDKRWREITKSPLTQLGVGSLIYKVRPVDRTGSHLLRPRFQKLAAMSAIDYDRVRIQEAERLGIRVSTLDEEVEKFRDLTSTHPERDEHSNCRCPSLGRLP